MPSQVSFSTAITWVAMLCLLALCQMQQPAEAQVSDAARRLGWDEFAGYVSTREEVLSKHRSDRRRYEEKMAMYQLQLQRHELGIEHLVNPNRIRQKIRSFQKKIDKMQGDLTEDVSGCFVRSCVWR
mmetsp:Transcript_13022/g.37714  ORF Transcript_13022/g.37714 Transcript_13022/m.37714 type:complete len:127 (-) Transcript_13022:473-853(-)